MTELPMMRGRKGIWGYEVTMTKALAMRETKATQMQRFEGNLKGSLNQSVRLGEIQVRVESKRTI